MKYYGTKIRGISDLQKRDENESSVFQPIKSDVLTDRWYKLNYHKQQNRFWKSDYRFNICHAGRRSGKTEKAKRRIAKRALSFCGHPHGNFIITAPTHYQTKSIYWEDMLDLIPKFALARRPVQTPVPTIFLKNGATIRLIGADKPERLEGDPIDGVLVDEIANMKASVWSSHLRPALSTKGRYGWADLIGVPEGRNHYYDMVMSAREDEYEEWALHHWRSDEILDDKEIASAKRELDSTTFEQEYGGEFVDYAGKCYYNYNDTVHAKFKLGYNPQADLKFCFDFNRSPGIAVVIQEQRLDEQHFKNAYFARDHNFAENLTCVIDEVYIPQNSNTEIVCNRLIETWKDHSGRVLLHGDATGGAKGSSALLGSDWDIISNMMRPVFQQRVVRAGKISNPRERQRVNCVNSRLKSTDGVVSMLVSNTCIQTRKDFDGVRVIEGGTGEIDKDYDDRLSHLTDAVGYYIHDLYRILKMGIFRKQQM